MVTVPFAIAQTRKSNIDSVYVVSLRFPVSRPALTAIHDPQRNQLLAALSPDEMNAPPAEAGGFGIRLKPVMVGHAADSDYTTLKLSSGGSGFRSSMYFFHTSSVTFPLEATQYPRAHRC